MTLHIKKKKKGVKIKDKNMSTLMPLQKKGRKKEVRRKNQKILV